MTINKKKILVYAHYYTPDVASTGQILKELSEGMLNRFDVSVICTVPSYIGTIEEKYKKKEFYTENINGVKVYRIRVPEFDKENKLSRVRNIIAYYFKARKLTKMIGDFDFIFSISQPPILGGMLGVYGKKIKKAKLIYNIQDFNPEQVMAVKYTKLGLVTKILMHYDKKTCSNADKIIVVGRDQIETLHERFGSVIPNTVLINNWIDEKAIYPLPENNDKVNSFRKKYGLKGKFVIMYSGNIGLYYDLENIVKTICHLGKSLKTEDGRDVVFAFVGNGSSLAKIKEYAENNNQENIVFAPYQNKNNLIYSLNAADVHWCVNARGIKGVSCPSKFYGIIACAKPVLGVLEEGTEIRYLMDKSKCGLCSDPGDYEQLESNIIWFINHSTTLQFKFMGKNGRKYLEENLTKNRSINKYIEEIMSL